MNIVVLAGGLSPERNVSLSSGSLIAQALLGLGHQVALVDLYFGIDQPLSPLEAHFSAPLADLGSEVSPQAPDLAEIAAQRQGDSKSQFGPHVLELCGLADIVFLALHGQCGEDGRVQATFDLLGIPYTGAGHISTAIAMDKDLTKRLLAGTDVATPKWRAVRYREQDVDSLTSTTPVPCVVKPTNNGSSIGVYIAHTKKELRAALLEGLAFGGRCVLEQFVAGRELSVGVLGDTALPSIEIRPVEGFYNYENKYQAGAAEELCPSTLTPEQEAQVQTATLKVYHALGLSVYSRADFILDDQGIAWFLEINTLPGMTPTSLLPQEAAAVGIDYPSLCQQVIDLSLEARKLGH